MAPSMAAISLWYGRQHLYTHEDVMHQLALG